MPALSNMTASSITEALAKAVLKAADSTALPLCLDNETPIIVFDIFFKPNNLKEESRRGCSGGTTLVVFDPQT